MLFFFGCICLLFLLQSENQGKSRVRTGIDQCLVTGLFQRIRVFNFQVHADAIISTSADSRGGE